MNPIVEKTMKIKLFTNNNATLLIKLLYWIGKPSKDKQSSYVALQSPVIIEGRKEISEELSEFLKILCSSYQFGIAFSENVNRTPNNGHALYIIKNLPKSAITEKKFQEVISLTLFFCPDIVVQYGNHLIRTLEKGDNPQFIGALNMYADMISQTVSLSHRNIEILKILQLLIPKPIDGNLIHSLLHDAHSEGLNFACLRVIHSITSMGDKLLKNMEGKYAIKCLELTAAIKKFLQEAITNIENITAIWRQYMNNEDTAELYDKILIVLQVLDSYARFSPSSELQNKIKPDNLLAETLNMPRHENDNLELIISCFRLINTLQCKFDVLSQAEDELKQQDLVDKFKLIITLYVRTCASVQENTNSDKVLLLVHEHIVNTLNTYGFSHSEADISPWLKALVGRDESCIDFLCYSIVSSIASLQSYYDKIVVITRNNAAAQPFEPTILYDRFCMESMIEDSTDVSTANVPLCFSRIVLGNIKMLYQKESTKEMDYFSEVIGMYIQGLQNPQVLAQYLLNDSELELPSSLARCCRCWLGQIPDKTNLKMGKTLATKLQYIFMSKDYTLVDSILQENVFPETLDLRMALLKSVLVYLEVDTMDSATVDSEMAVEAYLKLAQFIAQSISERFSCEISISKLNTVILDHPALFNKYDIFKPDARFTYVVKLLQEILADEAEIKNGVVFTYYKDSYCKLQLHLKKNTVHEDFDYFKIFSHLLLESSHMFEINFALLNIVFDASESFMLNESFVKLMTTVLGCVAQFINEFKKQEIIHSLLYSHLSNRSSLLFKSTSSGLVTFFKLSQRLIIETMQADDVDRFDHGEMEILCLYAGTTLHTMKVRIIS